MSVTQFPSIESILLKYCDDILQLPSHLPTHTIERNLLETIPKSEEIAIAVAHLGTFITISLRGNCHVWFHFLSIAYLIGAYYVVSFFQNPRTERVLP